MAADMGKGLDGGDEVPIIIDYQYQSRSQQQNSLIVENFIALLNQVNALKPILGKSKQNIYLKEIRDNLEFLFQEKRTKEKLLDESVYRKCVLKLCHDMLWIEAHYPEGQYPFFRSAIAYLKEECESHLNENPEYHYLLKLEEIKNNHSDLYQPFQEFETTFVRDVESIGEDKAKVYEAVTIQMDKILSQSEDFDHGAANRRFDILCAELSSERMNMAITGFTCLGGLAITGLGLGIQGLGCALIGFTLASGIIMGGLNLPFCLFGIAAGLGLLFLGSKVRDEGIAIFSGALKAQDSRERVCPGLKTLQKNVTRSLGQSLSDEEDSPSNSHHGNLLGSSEVKNVSENGKWTWSLPSPPSLFKRLPNLFGSSKSSSSSLSFDL